MFLRFYHTLRCEQKWLTQIIQAELCTAGQMRRSMFMRMWLSSSFNKLTTREILSSRYIPERGASLRFACSKVILCCDTPPGHLCMLRCHFNEGLELNILPIPCTFTLTWLQLRHWILFLIFYSRICLDMLKREYSKQNFL